MRLAWRGYPRWSESADPEGSGENRLPFLKTLTTCRPFFVNFSVRGFFSFGPCVSRLVRPS